MHTNVNTFLLAFASAFFIHSTCFPPNSLFCLSLTHALSPLPTFSSLSSSLPFSLSSLTTPRSLPISFSFHHFSLFLFLSLSPSLSLPLSLSLSLSLSLFSAVQIDDPLLQSAFDLSKHSTRTPKPWDGAEWAAFVKQKQAEGSVDIRTQLENLTLQLKGMKVRNTGQVRAQKALQMVTTKNKNSDSPEKVPPAPRERLLVDTVTKSYVNSSVSKSVTMSPKFRADKHMRGIDISGMHCLFYLPSLFTCFDIFFTRYTRHTTLTH